MDILDSLRKCARPVVFQTDIEEFPYSTAGTAFIVGFRQSVFVLMPQHVVNDWPIEKVLICPSWNSEYTFRYLNWWRIEITPEDQATSDLIIIKADLSDIPLAERADTQLLNLSQRFHKELYFQKVDITRGCGSTKCHTAKSWRGAYRIITPVTKHG